MNSVADTVAQARTWRGATGFVIESVPTSMVNVMNEISLTVTALYGLLSWVRLGQYVWGRWLK